MSFKKALSVLLAVVMILSSIPFVNITLGKGATVASAAYENATGGYADYVDFLENNDKRDLKASHLFSLLFDLLDRELYDEEGYSYNIGSTEQPAMMKFGSLDECIGSIVEILENGDLTGDFRNVDYSALKKSDGSVITRADGDLDIVYAAIQFAADNAELISTVMDLSFDFGNFLGYLFETEGDGETLTGERGILITLNQLLKRGLDAVRRELDIDLPDDYTVDQWFNECLNFCFEQIRTDAGIDFIGGVGKIDVTTQNLYELIKSMVFSFLSWNDIPYAFGTVNSILNEVRSGAYLINAAALGNETITEGVFYNTLCAAYNSDETTKISIGEDMSLMKYDGSEYIVLTLYDANGGIHLKFSESTGADTVEYSFGLPVTDASVIDIVRSAATGSDWQEVVFNGETYLTNGNYVYIKLVGYGVLQSSGEIDSDEYSVRRKLDRMHKGDTAVWVSAQDGIKSVDLNSKYIVCDGYVYSYEGYTNEYGENVYEGYVDLGSLLKVLPAEGCNTSVESLKVEENYEVYGSILGQLNHALYVFASDLTSEEFFESLGWEDGGNDKLSDNISRAVPAVIDILKSFKIYSISKFFDDFGVTDDVASQGLIPCGIAILNHVAQTIDPSAPQAYSLDQVVAYWCLYLTEMLRNEGFGGFSTDYKTVVYDGNGEFADKSRDEWTEVYLDMLSECAYCAMIEALGEEFTYIDTNTSFDYADAKAAGWGYEEYLDEIVDWAFSYVDGFLVAFDSIPHERGVLDGGGAFEKLNKTLGYILPLYLINDCDDGETFEFDILLYRLIHAGLNVDIEAILDLVSVNPSLINPFYGNSIIVAVLSVVQRIVNAVLPGSITDDMLIDAETFLGNDNLKKIVKNLLTALNSRKTALIPTVMVMLNRCGLFDDMLIDYIATVIDIKDDGNEYTADETRKRSTYFCFESNVNAHYKFTIKHTEGKEVRVKLYRYGVSSSDMTSDGVVSSSMNPFEFTPQDELYGWGTKHYLSVEYTDGSRDPITVSIERADPDFAYYISGGNAVILGYRGNESFVTIPEEINGYPVTRIDYFSNYNSTLRISSILIPDCVTSIGANAFSSYAYKDFTIFGNIGSYAQEYANENNIPFVPVDGRAYVKMNGNTVTTTPEYRVYGWANPNTEVSIICDEEVIGTTVSTRNGRWSYDAVLPDTESGKTYTVRARVTINGETCVSLPVNVTYDEQAVLFSRFETIHLSQSYVVTPETKGKAAGYISINPAYAVTFATSLINGDKVKDLKIVVKSSYETREYPASYNAEKDVWVASAYFDGSFMPGKITIVYNNDKEIDPDYKAIFILDPSGFVCEAVRSNNVEGVAASIYFRDASGEEILWDSDAFDQFNPQLTGENGDFSWDVPEGQWQVRFSKEGYEDACTDWLDVPPEHKNICVPMTTTLAPRVDYFNVYEDGAELCFSQYMDISTVNSDNISVGAISGTWTAKDAEESVNDASVKYARTFRFTSDEAIAGAVELRVDGVKNYAGIAIEGVYSKEAYVSVELTGIEAPEVVEIEMGESKTINVAVLPKDAASGYLTVENANGKIAQTDSSVALSKSGTASITVQGVLVGETELTVTLKGTSLERKIKVTVLAQTHKHSYTEVVTNPTCTKEGFTTYTCEGCGDSYIDNKTAANGHSYTKVDVTNPTCTTEGYTTHTCSVCNDSYIDSITPVLPHSYTSKVVEPTCTEKGYTISVCSVCGHTTTDNETPAKGHVDSNSDGKCDECGSTVKLSLWARILAFFNRIINKIKNLFK